MYHPNQPGPIKLLAKYSDIPYAFILPLYAFQTLLSTTDWKDWHTMCITNIYIGLESLATVPISIKQTTISCSPEQDPVQRLQMTNLQTACLWPTDHFFLCFLYKLMWLHYVELFSQKDPKAFCKLKRCKGAGGGGRRNKEVSHLLRKCSSFFWVMSLVVKIGKGHW